MLYGRYRSNGTNNIASSDRNNSDVDDSNLAGTEDNHSGLFIIKVMQDE